MEHKTIRAGALELHASEVGQGSPLVVLLHGWCCRRSDWDQTLTALADDAHLLALDLPGHGASSEQVPEEWTVAGLAGALVTAVKATGAERVVLVGHSMGGAVALEAARALDTVDAVVLLDTFVIPYGDLTGEQADAIEAPFREDFTAAVEALVEQNVASILSRERRRWIIERMAAAEPARMLPLWHDLLRWSPDQAFADLATRKMPIHAINGDLVPEAARQRCRAHVREWVLDGAGHFPQFEMPERFQEMLRQVLGAL